MCYSCCNWNIIFLFFNHEDLNMYLCWCVMPWLRSITVDIVCHSNNNLCRWLSDMFVSRRVNASSVSVGWVGVGLEKDKYANNDQMGEIGDSTLLLKINQQLEWFKWELPWFHTSKSSPSYISKSVLWMNFTGYNVMPVNMNCYHQFKGPTI